MIHAETIKHREQEKDNSCGAAVVAMLFGISEAMARKACKTKASGTHNFNVVRAIQDVGLNTYHVFLEKNYLEIKDFLAAMSFHFPIYASCRYRSRACGGKGGRDYVRDHAVLLADGMIFDPSEKSEVDIDCYEHTFGKSLVFKSIIIVDEERPNYGKRKTII